jgi:hypothetical protein
MPHRHGLLRRASQRRGPTSGAQRRLRSALQWRVRIDPASPRRRGKRRRR